MNFLGVLKSKKWLWFQHLAAPSRYRLAAYSANKIKASLNEQHSFSQRACSRSSVNVLHRNLLIVQRSRRSNGQKVLQAVVTRFPGLSDFWDTIMWLARVTRMDTFQWRSFEASSKEPVAKGQEPLQDTDQWVHLVQHNAYK